MRSNKAPKVPRLEGEDNTSAIQPDSTTRNGSHPFLHLFKDAQISILRFLNIQELCSQRGVSTSHQSICNDALKLTEKASLPRTSMNLFLRVPREIANHCTRLQEIRVDEGWHRRLGDIRIESYEANLKQILLKNPKIQISAVNLKDSTRMIFLDFKTPFSSLEMEWLENDVELKEYRSDELIQNSTATLKKIVVPVVAVKRIISHHPSLPLKDITLRGCYSESRYKLEELEEGLLEKIGKMYQNLDTFGLIHFVIEERVAWELKWLTRLEALQIRGSGERGSGERVEALIISVADQYLPNLKSLFLSGFTLFKSDCMMLSKLKNLETLCCGIYGRGCCHILENCKKLKCFQVLETEYGAGKYQFARDLADLCKTKVTVPNLRVFKLPYSVGLLGNRDRNRVKQVFPNVRQIMFEDGDMGACFLHT